MPLHMMFVRHGRSEPNRIQSAEKLGTPIPPEVSDAIYDRHDSDQRLSQEGCEQADTTAAVLRRMGLAPSTFDGRYVSLFNRCLETAARLDPEATWLPTPTIVERDWGTYGATPGPLRAERFPDTERMRRSNPFFARFDNGESVFDNTFQVAAFIDMCERDMAGRRVVAVTHGEYMWSVRFKIERMLPAEWVDLDDDPSQRIGNCAILEYTRSDPEGIAPDAPSLSSGWRRMTDPINGRAPYGGEWVRLPGKRMLTPAEMLAYVERSPRLLEAGPLQLAS